MHVNQSRGLPVEGSGVFVTDVASESRRRFHVVHLPNAIASSEAMRLKESALSGPSLVLHLTSIDSFRISLIAGAIKRLADGQLTSVSMTTPMDLAPLLALADDAERVAVRQALEIGTLKMVLEPATST